MRKLHAGQMWVHPTKHFHPIRISWVGPKSEHPTFKDKIQDTRLWASYTKDGKNIFGKYEKLASCIHDNQLILNNISVGDLVQYDGLKVAKVIEVKSKGYAPFVIETEKSALRWVRTRTLSYCQLTPLFSQ